MPDNQGVTNHTEQSALFSSSTDSVSLTPNIWALRALIALVVVATGVVGTAAATEIGVPALMPHTEMAAAALPSDGFAGFARSLAQGVDDTVYGLLFSQPEAPTLATIQHVQRHTSSPLYASAPTSTPAEATKPSSPAEAPRQTIINQQPVIERVVETERVVTQGGITEDELDQRMNALSADMSQKIAGLQGINTAAFQTTNQALSSVPKPVTDASALTGMLGVGHGGTGVDSYAPGDLLYASATDTLSVLSVGADGQILTMTSGMPSWNDAPAGGGGSGGSDSQWATTTSLAIAPATLSDVVLVGTNATSTTGNLLEVAGNALFRNALVADNTVTAPSFNATSTDATSTFTAASFATASTSDMIVSDALSIGNLNGVLKAVSGVVTSALVDLTSDVTGVLPVGHGGTGLASVQAGSVLVGNGAGALATTTRGDLTETGSSVLTITNGAGALLGGGTSIQVKQANGSTGGFLSSTDWNTFNNKQNLLSFTYPLLDTANTISLSFGTTTNNVWAGTNSFAGNVTLTNATSSSLAITTATSTLLKTTANGSVVPAVPGLDYALPNTGAFAYLFPNNATSTSIGFNGGLTTTNATSSSFAITGAPSTLLKTNANGSVVPAVAGVDYALPNTGAFAYLFPNNATSTLLSLNGGLITTDATTSNATSSSFAITSVPSTLLKTTANGSVIPAVAGVDYASPASLFSYLFPGNATTTQLSFNAGLVTSNATATNATSTNFAIRAPRRPC